MKHASRVLPVILATCLWWLLSGVSQAVEGSATDGSTDREAGLPAAWEAVRDGRAIVLMRHALAPGMGDPSGFDVNDCATQRNLSDEGRAQARSVGDLLRDNGISAATVLSSQWCRCRETAELLDVGEPVPEPMLNSFFESRGSADQQTQSLKSAMEQWLPGDRDVRILVTHQVNISALTGQFASSGSLLIVTLDGDAPSVLATIDTR